MIWGNSPRLFVRIIFLNKSNFVISSYIWEQAGDATGFHPWSHKLLWDGKKLKQKFYYKFNSINSYGWDQIDHWEYMQLEYGDNNVLEAEIHFPARSRSNDISSGFLTSETENGRNGYWSLNMDHNQDNTFYYVSHIRTDQADPYTGTYDHIKIFLHNTPQHGKALNKIAQGILKIVRDHTLINQTSSEPLLNFSNWKSTTPYETYK